MSDKPKRKPSSWIQAVKVFNEDNKDFYCIPRKGSKYYTQIKEMSELIKKGEAPNKVKRKAEIDIVTEKPKKEFVTLKAPTPPPALVRPVIKLKK